MGRLVLTPAACSPSRRSQRLSIKFLCKDHFHLIIFTIFPTVFIMPTCPRMPIYPGRKINLCSMSESMQPSVWLSRQPPFYPQLHNIQELSELLESYSNDSFW